MPKTRLATYRHVGPYTEIDRGWQTLEKILPDRPWERPTSRIFSVYHDDWMTCPADRQRSELGFSVPWTLRLPARTFELIIPAGLYIASRHSVSREENRHVWRQLTGRWLPRRGSRPTNIPAISEHAEWPRAHTNVPRKVFLGIDIQFPQAWKIPDPVAPGQS